jgi:hypothetical protein
VLKKVLQISVLEGQLKITNIPARRNSIKLRTFLLKGIA